MLVKADKKPAALEKMTRGEWEKGLSEFVNTLKALPAKEDIKANDFADGALFIPIGTIEEKLDYYFRGLWKVTDFTQTVIVNEIAVTLQLHVFHPFAGVWIERTGVAAVQIQLRAEYEKGPDGKRVKKPVDVLDVSKKIANTVQKDLPHAKAEALKNAAKSLGNIFGRNLNRGPEDAHKEIESVEDAAMEIAGIDDLRELLEFYKALPSTMRSDKRIKRVLKEQETYLKAMKSEAEKGGENGQK